MAPKWIIFSVGWLLNLWCLWRIWFRTGGSLPHRLVYSLLQVVPFFGAVAYAFYDAPDRHGITQLPNEHIRHAPPHRWYD